MKNHSPLLAMLLACAFGLAAAGCSSFSRSSAPDASKPVGGKAINLLQFRDDVKATRVALNRTTDALNRLPDAPNAQEAHASFSAELAILQKIAGKTSLESADIRNRGKELFAQWEAEALSIKNPDIRAVAEQRRQTLQQSYDNMLTPLISARADLTTTLSDLADLQKALALDLTPAGIAATRKAIDNVNAQTATTVRSLDALTAELDQIAAILPAPTVAPAK